MGRSLFILPLSHITIDDVKLVGKKALLYSDLTQEGFLTPPGFFITSLLFEQFLEENNLTYKLSQLVQTINFEHHDSVIQVAKHLQELITHGTFSKELSLQLFKPYHSLGKLLQQPSVTLCVYSFSEKEGYGQEFLSHTISGESNILLELKNLWASFYKPDQLLSRFKQGVFPLPPYLASIAVKTLKPTYAGKIITTEQKKYISIEVVANKENKQSYLLDKKTLALEPTPERKIKAKGIPKQHLNESQLLHLGLIARKLEMRYFFPQVIDFSIVKNKVYITNTNPLTIPSPVKKVSVIKKLVLAKASPVSAGIYTGPARLVQTAYDAKKLSPGEILITAEANPNLMFSDFVQALKKAKALVIERGSKQSHAVLLAKKLGIPAIIGAQGITRIVKTGSVITVNGITGEVFQGSFLHEKPRILYQ